MNPLSDYEPTARECLAVSQWGRLGLVWRCVREAIGRWWDTRGAHK